MTYYIDAGYKKGKDTNSGLSEKDAFATIQKVADTVKAGDTIFIKIRKNRNIERF